MSIPAWTFKNLCKNPSAVLVGDEFMGRRDAWPDVSSPIPKMHKISVLRMGWGVGRKAKLEALRPE